jgi:hypothetical protein
MKGDLSQPIDPIVAQEAAKMQRPIPGQSLTNDPENPAPYEKAPVFTNLNKAQDAIFSKLIDEEVYVPIMSLLDTGEATIMELTQNLLYVGFRAGQWNPDLMLMLAEPTAYMIMALAERAGIDYEIDEEEDEEKEENKELNNSLSRVKETINKKAPDSKQIPAGAIPKEIVARLDEAPVESLLAAKEAPDAGVDVDVDVEEEESLLGVPQ